MMFHHTTEKKLYPDISKVENMLRKIIYLFMLKTVGSKWIDVGTPEKIQIRSRGQKSFQKTGVHFMTFAIR